MALVKTFSVGEGDTSYIVHGSDSFTIIDCCLNDYNKDDIIAEMKAWAATKGLSRFISTHPDEDHFGGIEWLDEEGLVRNFLCRGEQSIKDGRNRIIQALLRAERFRPRILHAERM